MITQKDLFEFGGGLATNEEQDELDLLVKNELEDDIITPFVQSFIKKGFTIKKSKFMNGEESPCDEIKKCKCTGWIFTFIKGLDVITKCAHCKENY